MKRSDKSKPSLVEFLGSIKFSRDHATAREAESTQEHFARLQPSTRRRRLSEENQLIRSAN